MMPRGKKVGGRLRGRGGFTLVELLLALSLMSMLLALAYGGLRASTRAADRGQTILQDSGRIRMAHQFVRKQLNQMMPLVFAESEDRTERSVFLGSADRIRFVAPMPGYLGFGGPQVQELAIVQGDDSLELVLSHALLQGFEEELLFERLPISLLDKIEHAQFSFLGRDENGELMGWTTSWTETATLPESVALEVEFVEDVYIRWPLLTASVRVDESALSELAGAQSADPAYGATIRDLINQRKSRQ
jgi:general secretion pathway protein J